MPGTIRESISNANTLLQKIGSMLNDLKEVDLTEILANKLEISEDDALLLLSGKISLPTVLLIRKTLKHVPASYCRKEKTTLLRMKYINNIMKSNCVDMSLEDLEVNIRFLECYCPSFLDRDFDETFDKSLWNLSKEEENWYNMFLTPPVKDCLSCGGTLGMYNPPSKAVVFGVDGPVPSTKVTLECRTCNIKYGIAKYTNSEGRHFYPIDAYGANSNLVEISNVTYMEYDLYRWIPSLG